MRKIKFRAWNKEANTMIYPEDTSCYFELSDTGLSVMDMTIEPDDLGFAHIDATIMQYTGLKDKNGVEIYEGDYIETRTFKKVKVFYDDGSFKVEYQKRNNLILIQTLGDFLTKNKSSKIIGNIYENPELLDEESRI